jgi:hypothetical protein
VATNLGQLAVKITADLKDLSTGLTKAVSEIKMFAVKVQANLQGLTGAFKSFGSSIAGMFERMFASIYNTIKLAMKYIIAALIAAGIASVKLAADAHETEEKFSAAMGNMEESARKFSDQLAKSLRLNPYEVRRIISEFQILLTTMGYSNKTAADMSTTLTQLGYDMAALYNTKPEEMFDALQSAMVGNARSMRQYGVLLDENTVKTWAMNHQIYLQGGEMTAAQKSAIVYAIILEKMGKAQGYMQKHLNEGRSVLKSFWDQLKVTGIEIGEKLLPIVNQIAGAMRDWLAANGPAIADAVGKWMTSLGNFITYLQTDWRGALLVVKDMVVAVFELMADSIVAVIMSIGPRIIAATKDAITDPMARSVAIATKAHEIQNDMLSKMWKLPASEQRNVGDVAKDAWAQATKEIDDYISKNPVDSKASQVVTDNLKKRLSDIYDSYLGKIQVAESKISKSKGTYGAGNIPTTASPAYPNTAAVIAGTQARANELEKSQTAWQKYLEQLRKDMAKTSDYFANKFTEAIQSVEGSFSDLFYNISAEGMSFKDALIGMADSIRKAFLRMASDIIARNIMAKIAEPFGGMFGLEGGTGVKALDISATGAAASLNGLAVAAQNASVSMGGAAVGGGVGAFSLFGGGGGWGGGGWSPENYSTPNTPITNPEFLRAGGIVGQRANIRPVPISVFANAPRARMGLNLEPDAIPIIAHRGERVLTAEQNREYSRGTSNVNINVSAIDAAGTYRFLSSNKKAIASMVQGANRYNHPGRRDNL